MKNEELPIGIIPKKVYSNVVDSYVSVAGGLSMAWVLRSRLNLLEGAINRYLVAHLIVNVEWVIEYNDILKELGMTKKGFTLK